jgi:hypothetical protein
VRRGEVWQRLGPPTDQLGSANDPRATEERGHLWNEKWIYVDPHSGEPERIVLWHRYDLQGVFTVMPDGSWVSESIGRA